VNRGHRMCQQKNIDRHMSGASVGSLLQENFLDYQSGA
jgi:hypothetical protein